MIKKLKKNIQSKVDVKKITSQIINFTRQEANETRVAARIFSKIISNYFKTTKKEVTEEEIKFLKDHSADLAKILPVIAAMPTPIPYLELALILKKFGVDILPNGKGLEIPDGHTRLKV